MSRRRTSSDTQPVPNGVDTTTSDSSTLSGSGVPPSHPHHASSLQAPPGRRLRVHSTPTQYAPPQRVPQPIRVLSPDARASAGTPPLSASLTVPFAYRQAHASSPSSPSFRPPFSSTPLNPSPSPSPARSDFSIGAGTLLPSLSPQQPAGFQPQQQQHARRHSRIHSRNLSVFFPRPGVTPEIIAEDGQEFEQPSDAPVTLISPARQSSAASPAHSTPRSALAPGFKFGSGRTIPDTPSSAATNGSTFGAPSPTTSNGITSAQVSPTATTTTARRGHHHRHSLSHQFFSFMDPTVTVQTDANSLSVPGQPPTPASPWQPISPFPTGAMSGNVSPALRASATPAGTLSLHAPQRATHSLFTVSAFAALEFIAGAKLWVTGQQSGSLSCTGLGYWIVFDALGVLLGPGAAAGFWTWLLGEGGGAVSALQRPYGHDRVETTAFFAQTIYLLFAAVYVCKESVEHFLLSLGESHHHHPSDEYNWNDYGSPFPGYLLAVCLTLVVLTGHVYSNHARLLDAGGNAVPVPSLDSVLYQISKIPVLNKTPLSFFAPSRRFGGPGPAWWTNPFTLAPAAFAAALIGALLLIEQHHHQGVDLVLSGLEAFLMFRVAWPAAVALGTVLLQTAPDRGALDGRMEAFLRVMKEVERHPQVVHLPPPHVWQVTAPSKLSGTSSSTTLVASGHEAQFIVSLELHVRKGLNDADALALTRWAWEQCYGALNPRGVPKSAWGEKSGGGITVGIVRG